MKKVLKFTSAVLIIVTALLAGVWWTRPDDISLEDVTPPIPHRQYSHFVAVDQVRLHYQEKGNGAPLVLLHGYGASTSDWNEVFGPLSNQFRVIAVDLKGFGFSEKPAGDYTTGAQAELVLKLLDQLGIQRASLCGNSMGGAVSLACALTHPDRVERLILVDSVASNQAALNSGLVPPILVRPVIGPVLAALALKTDDLVREALSRSIYDDSLVTDDRVETYYRPLRTRGGQRAALAVARQWDLGSIEQGLRRVRAPTLVIWGKEDEIIPLAHGQWIHQEMKGSRMVVFPHCGHLPQVEQPREFADEVKKFMNRGS